MYLLNNPGASVRFLDGKSNDQCAHYKASSGILLGLLVVACAADAVRDETCNNCYENTDASRTCPEGFKVWTRETGYRSRRSGNCITANTSCDNQSPCGSGEGSGDPGLSYDVGSRS